MKEFDREILQEFQKAPFEEALKELAQYVLKRVVFAEAKDFLEQFTNCYDSYGRKRLVRNGYHKERQILWSGGSISIQMPRIRDREGKIKYQSHIIPRYLRRSDKLEKFIPYLYLKGVSTGDFSDVLGCLLGKDVQLSSSTVVNLKERWMEEYREWAKRDLSDTEYVYWWADGVYFNVRMENERSCLLVLMGVRADGKKELVAVCDGYRESKLSWKEICLDLKKRGLKKGPRLAIGDGSLGFWAALAEEFPETKEQRCWVHKTANVLDKMPKSYQSQAKRKIHEIYMAPTKKEAYRAFDDFVKMYEAKYCRAVDCLLESKQETLAFYDFPAQHWKHIRSTNPIESTFATVRHRTKRTKGCGSKDATLMMVFKLAKIAEERWHRINKYALIPLVMKGKVFEDGVLKEAA